MGWLEISAIRKTDDKVVRRLSSVAHGASAVRLQSFWKTPLNTNAILYSSRSSTRSSNTRIKVLSRSRSKGVNKRRAIRQKTVCKCFRFVILVLAIYIVW